MTATTISYAYLTRLPGVRGGNMIVADTRVGVHDVVGLWLNGASIDETAASLPGLTRAQIYECLAYYEDHKDEVEQLVARQMAVGT